MIAGGGRFRILEATSGRSFATAAIEELPDVETEQSDEEVDALLAAFAGLAEAADAEAPTVSATDPELSFRLAALVELDNGPRQALLELESEWARTRYLTKLFDQLARNIARQREVHGRAQSNGRVEPRD